MSLLRKRIVKPRLRQLKRIQPGLTAHLREQFRQRGYPLYTYQTYILEDFIKGGKYRNKLDEETKKRIDTAYKEMNAHVNLKWK